MILILLIYWFWFKEKYISCIFFNKIEMKDVLFRILLRNKIISFIMFKMNRIGEKMYFINLFKYILVVGFL